MIAENITPNDPIEVVIRPALPSELRLVQGTWSRTFAMRDRQRSCGPKPRETTGICEAVDIGRRMDGVMLDASLVVKAHHRLVDQLLSAPDTIVAVACLPGDDRPIAWACWQSSTLHYVYTMPEARHATVARQLVLHSRASVASHSTPDGVALMRYLGTR